MTSIESDPLIPRPSAIPRKSVDRFLWGFPVFALGCEVFLAALSYLERINGSFIVMLIFLALIVLIMLVIAMVGIVVLFMGRFKGAAALLLAPAIIVAPFALPILGYQEFPILRYEYFAFDFIRFHLTKASYAEVVEKLSPAERASRVVIFVWGREGLAVTATSEYWLVYDESGEIALPDEERSQAWKDRAKQEEHYFTDEQCTFVAYHLSGNFYSVANHCPY